MKKNLLILFFSLTVFYSLSIAQNPSLIYKDLSIPDNSTTVSAELQKVNKSSGQKSDLFLNGFKISDVNATIDLQEINRGSSSSSIRLITPDTTRMATHSYALIWKGIDSANISAIIDSLNNNTY